MCNRGNKPRFFANSVEDGRGRRHEKTRSSASRGNLWNHHTSFGADSFYNLVKHHFYDNASFFRVVPGFVVQFGISAYPAVSAAWKNADLKDDPVTQSNKRGYLTFATAGPNTRTTQVFISLKDNAGLDAQGFAPFGVVDPPGMKAVEMFYDQYGDSTPRDY